MQQPGFTAKKFRSLSPQSRYKKIADLLWDFLRDASQAITQSPPLDAAKQAGQAETKGPCCEKQIRRLQRLRLFLSWMEPISHKEDLSIKKLYENSLSTSLELSKCRKEEGSRCKLNIKDLRIYYDAYLYMAARSGLGTKSIPGLADLETEPAADAPALLPYRFCLWNLRSAHNAGAILRTADCFGLSGIILAGYTPGAEKKAFRAASMGTENWVAIERMEDDPAILKNALKEGQRLIALETEARAIPLEDFSFPEEGGLILVGNEELGLPDTLLEAVDDIVSIPMFGRKASLNVSNACAVAASWLRLSRKNRPER